MPYGPLVFAALVVIVAIGYVTRPGHRSRQMRLDVDRTGESWKRSVYNPREFRRRR